MKKNVETWKAIDGFEGLYEISNLGRVKSLRSGRMMKPYDNGKGYQKVELSKDGKVERFYIHRLVAMAFIPNSRPLIDTLVNHKDENPGNNRVENLEWCNYNYNLTYGSAQAKRCLSRYGAIKISA
jgi:hypothetical protein